MRETAAADYAETRDALARDWTRLFSRALPWATFTAIPNIGAAAADYAVDWGLQGIILSGGNDVGEAPERDATEAALLVHALARGIAVLGVCRGMQFIQHFLGGALGRLDDRSHIACEHPVTVVAAVAPFAHLPASLTVNSYHSVVIDADALAAPLVAVAVDGAGHVEAFTHPGGRIAGVMWHPERHADPKLEDLRLFEELFHV